MSTTDGTLTWELLGAYEAADQDFDGWCRLIDLNPFTSEAEVAYDLVHEGYASLWLQLGDAFHERLWPIAARWRTRQGRPELAIRDSLRANSTGGRHVQ